MESEEVSEKMNKHSDRCSAKAVTDKVNLLDFSFFIKLSPIGNKRIVIGSAVSCVVEFLGMCFAVINRCADNLGIKLAGSVPRTAHRSD